MRKCLYTLIILFSFITIPLLSIYCFIPQMNERILVSTDRKLYIAGENVLYSLFLIDNIDQKLASYESVGYVIITNTNGGLVGKSQVKIKSGKADNAIYLEDTLQTGYYQISAYTNFMKNGSKSNYFKSQIIIVNRFDKNFEGLIRRLDEDNQTDSLDKQPERSINESLDVTIDKTCYKSRQKCGFKVMFKGPGQYADLSISVIEKNNCEILKPKVIHPVAQNNSSVLNWAGNDSNLPYLSEDRFTELRGRVTDQKGNPLKEKLLFLTTPDSIVHLEYDITNSQGYFRFLLSEYYSGKDLYIKVKKDSSFDKPQITIEKKFSCAEIFAPETVLMDSDFIEYLFKCQDIVRVQKIYSQLNKPSYKSKFNSQPVPFYSVPDIEVIPSEYESISNIFEMSNEIIPGLRIKRDGNYYSALVFDGLRKQYFSQEPVIFFNGIMLDDINQIINLGTKDIKRIDLISANWFLNQLKFPGVLAVFSENQTVNNYKWNANNITIRAENYKESPYKKNIHPNESDTGSLLPDFRQLLFWEPDVHINCGQEVSFEFLTSDNEGDFLIKISGIKDQGNLIQTISQFSVNND